MYILQNNLLDIIIIIWLFYLLYKIFKFVVNLSGSYRQRRTNVAYNHGKKLQDYYYYYFYFFLSILLISRSMDLWNICIVSLCSIDKLSFTSFSNSASSFSSQYLILFLKLSRSCVLLLPTPFTSSSVLQWRHEGVNLFSEYDHCN